MIEKMRWEKHGLLFDALDSPIPHHISHAQAAHAVVLGDLTRVYFSGRDSKDTDGNYTSATYWVEVRTESPLEITGFSDGPVLEKGGRGHFDEHGIYPFSTIEYESKIYGFYGGWSRPKTVPFNVAIGMCVSDDGGVSFRRLNKGPILPPQKDEPFIISGPKIRCFDGKFYLFYIAGSKWITDEKKAEPIYRIRLAVSEDLVSWTRVGEDLIPFSFEDEAQASPDVFQHGDGFVMLFSYRQARDYRGRDGSYRMGIAESKDLMNWNRRTDLDVLEPGPNGREDSDQIAYPHHVEMAGKRYVFYLGNGVGRNGLLLSSLEIC